MSVGSQSSCDSISVYFIGKWKLSGLSINFFNSLLASLPTTPSFPSFSFFSFLYKNSQISANCAVHNKTSTANNTVSSIHPSASTTLTIRSPRCAYNYFSLPLEYTSCFSSYLQLMN